MAWHFITKMAAVLAGGAMALFATTALAQDCANGRCGGAWVSAAPGYVFAPPEYGQPAPQPYAASPCGQPSCGYVPPPPPAPCSGGCYQQPAYPYPVQPCGAPVGYACGAVYQANEVSATGDWGGGVGVTEFSGGGGGGGGGAPLAGFGNISGFVGSHSAANTNASGSANVNVTVNSSASAYATSTSTSTANAFGGGVGGGGGHHHHGGGGGGKPQGGCGCLGSGGGSSGGMGGWSGGAGNTGGWGSNHAAKAAGGRRH